MTAQLSVAAPNQGPCADWAALSDAIAYGFVAEDELNNDVFALCATVASEFLFAKSAYQFSGTCTQTIRPITRQYLAEQPMLWWEQYGYPSVPDLVEGVWWNLTGPFGFPNPALPWDGGRRIPTIELGAYPVTDILSVLIDGAEIDPAVYRLDRWHQLIRTDGDLWPLSQDLLLADTEPGTFSITFRWGVAPPAMGVMACAELATEMTKHSDPSKQTSLPLRVTSVSRAGVSYSLPDVMDLVEKERTGMYFVDQFLSIVNPHKLHAPARILTPDLHPSGPGPRRLGSQ